MIKIGLLGAARIAPKGIIHPALKREDSILTHLACRDHDRGRDYCREHNLENMTLTDYNSLAETAELDMIYCALPPAFHLDLVEAALLRGVHVLCEKPISMTAQEARRMVSASAKSGAVLLEAFHYFFHPAFDIFKDYINRPELGEITSARSVFKVSIPNRPGQLRYIPELGGGALMDLGCYNLHALRQLFGEPTDVRAKADMQYGVDVALTAQARFGNIQAELACDMRETAPREDYIELISQNGSLRFDSFVAPHRGYKISSDITGLDDIICGPSEMTTYDHQLGHFIDMINGAAPRIAAQDAAAQMAAIDALYAAAGMR